MKLTLLYLEIPFFVCDLRLEYYTTKQQNEMYFASIFSAGPGALWQTVEEDYSMPVLGISQV